MYCFAIIDDDIHDLNQISKALKEHCDYHHIKYNVDLYNDPLEFSFNKYYDAIFLDIDMPSIDGMKLANQINSYYSTKIIFVTNYTNYINIVFNVRPFHFINKCNLKIEIIKVLTLLFKYLNKEKRRLKTKRGIENVGIEDIYYIQKKDNLTMIYTKDKEYDIWESISTLYDKLKSFHIEKVNQSTLVNLRYIKVLNNKTIIRNINIIKENINNKYNFLYD